MKASSDAVVLVVTLDASGNPVTQGSGFIVAGDGKVVTNYHVIEGADSAIVKMSNGGLFPVEGVLAESETDDLAVLKVSGSGLPVLRLGDTKSVSTGEKVIAIGSPLGLEGTVTDGIVSAIREDSETNTPLIQTSAPISHGSSGGPLMDLSGRVVGILTFKFSSGENLNFAVAVSALTSLLGTAHSAIPLSNLRVSGFAGPGNHTRATEDEIQGHITRGEALARDGDLEGAIQEYSEALRLDPNNEKAHVSLEKAHVSLGITLAQEGDGEGAIAEYRLALRLNPKDEDTHLRLAAALSLSHDIAGAVEQYRVALMLDPKNQDARLQLGWELAEMGDFDGEIAEAREALRLNPNDESEVTNLCMGYLRKGHWEGLKWVGVPLEPMIDDLREVVRTGPRNARAHYELGVYLEKMRNRQEAFQEYRAAYELKPENPDYQKAYERLSKKVHH